MNIRQRFRAALPHELDGPGPQRHDIPTYVARVEELNQYIAEMERRHLITNKRLGYATDALRKIANEDYRGPRPRSAQVAIEALEHEVEPW